MFLPFGWCWESLRPGQALLAKAAMERARARGRGVLVNITGSPGEHLQHTVSRLGSSRTSSSSVRLDPNMAAGPPSSHRTETKVRLDP